MNENRCVEEALLKILMKQAIKETCLDTTTHAIPYIFKASNHTLMRVLWVLCFLISASYCLVPIYQTFEQYFSYPSYFRVEFVQEIPPQFPAISFCNNSNTTAF